MTSWDGKQTVQLTNNPESESSPRWSPDDKYISFLSSRSDGQKKEDNKDNQDNKDNKNNNIINI